MPAEPSNDLVILPEVAQALSQGEAVVALESTVITHGLPFPENLRLAQEMETAVRSLGACPATIAVLDGAVRVGLQEAELERLAGGSGMHKISGRDFAPARVHGWSGGTTVAGTLLAAHRAGIQVFATGGIGGVHRQPAYDISADLIQLARTPLVVVCAGAKAILDLDATLEYLETHSVPVAGFQTDDFPAFYARSSGLKASCRVDSPEEAARLVQAHWQTGLQSAILLAVPPPESSALPREEMERLIQQALREAGAAGVRGQAVTPFLLERMNALSRGRSLQVNLDLLLQNARIATQTARALRKV